MIHNGQNNNFDYYTFQANMVITNIQKEIEFCKNIPLKNIDGQIITFIEKGIPENPIKEYYEYLLSRIYIDKKDRRSLTGYDNTGTFYEIKKMNPDEYGSEMDKIVYKKPWHKLKEFHKIVKIQEYVEELHYKTGLDLKLIAKNKKKIIDEILEGLKTKKITKKKNTIEYNENEMKITYIPCIEKNRKGFYIVEWE